MPSGPLILAGLRLETIASQDRIEFQLPLQRAIEKICEPCVSYGRAEIRRTNVPIA